MSSNYMEPFADELVRDDEVWTNADDMQERPCMRCRGVGTVLVHGQETDCMDCDGFGSVLID